MEGFTILRIPDDIFEFMRGKSFKSDCTIPREDLRFLKVLHRGFDGLVHEGELVCSKDIAEDLLEVFVELFEASYPIEKIRLVDYYDAVDELSMADNNSSAFNFRRISFSDEISHHGLGLAVDINPLYNPYVKMVGDRLSIEPANGAPYVDREKEFTYKLTGDDICCRIFKKYGFTWGGDWTHAKDYQHFEKI